MTGANSSTPTPNKKGCWYKIDSDYCPVCGRDRTERTRMPGPKPTSDDPVEAYWLTHNEEEHYDWCLG